MNPPSPRFFALVPAAGSGARFGAEIPKQYLTLAGKPLLHHSLQTLYQCPRISAVWLTLSPQDEWWQSLDNSAFGERLQVLRCGGQSRAETVWQTLAAMQPQLHDNDWVLVHDAVRPCLAAKNLNTLLDELANDPVGGLLAVPLADTLKRSDADGRVAATHAREQLWQAQTPQMFRYALLCQALQAKTTVTDEASAIEAAGYAPRLVRSDMRNFKVTFASDLALAELILQGEST